MRQPDFTVEAWFGAIFFFSNTGNLEADAKDSENICVKNFPPPESQWIEVTTKLSVDRVHGS